MSKYLLLLFLCSSILNAVVECGDVVGCYYGSWAFNRPALGQFGTDDIDPTLCTHLYYSFVGLNNATQDVEILDTNIALNQSGYLNFTGLRQINPSAKFLIAIGGWSQGSYAFSVISQNATRRAQFIQQILQLIQQYGFDGLDFDWEYPSQRDSLYGDADRENFVTLLRETREAFEPLGLLITVAVGSSPTYIDVAYDVRAISEVADLINFMTYDIHGPWETVTGVNAPLRDPTGSNISVEYFTNRWLDAGVDPAKLVIGIPTYGKSFTLRNASDTSIGAPVTGAGTAGPYLQEASSLSYYEILENLQAGWTEVYDEQVESPYAYSGDQWVGYDNERSIAAKVRFVCSNGLAGVMTWAIDLDDFGGYYGQRYPLLNALNTVREC